MNSGLIFWEKELKFLYFFIAFMYLITYFKIGFFELFSVFYIIYSNRSKWDLYNKRCGKCRLIMRF